MVIIDKDKCKGCKKCQKNCPLGAIEVIDKKAVVSEKCVMCGICVKVCNFEAILKDDEVAEGEIKCTSCPIQCLIKPNYTGACGRYENCNGILKRNRELVYENPKIAPVEHLRPLITAVGAGTEYPCCKPAPHIVQDLINGVDVVTVVTEAPLSYSGVKVKIDTNYHIGEEGAKVKRDGQVVGMVDTEEYGSKMLSIGGANNLTSKSGFLTAKTVVDICNGEKIVLTVENGATMDIQVGARPIINGIEDSKMRIGCGSATIGMFAAQLSRVVDEAIVLDYHVVGLLSEHMAGKEVGMTWSGVIPNARKSTKGRYFGEHGVGWGGTNIEKPHDAILKVDKEVAKKDIKVLVTETTGQKYALFKLTIDGAIEELSITPEIKEVMDLISANCEEARVSALYVGGTGGSARAGVTSFPIKLTKAVHEETVHMTIGGAPAFILPGGGINFMVDVEKVVSKAFTWVPTPATVAPVEYTMRRDKYEEIGGHLEKIISLSSLKKR